MLSRFRLCYNRGQGEVFGWPFSHCPWRNRDLGYREGWINKMHRESRQDTSVWRNRPGVNVAISVLESFPIPHSPLPGGLSRLPDFGFYKLHLHYFKNIPFLAHTQFE